MNTSTRRYLLALLWHWAPPAFIGFAVGSVLATLQIVEVLRSVDGHFYQALEMVVDQCVTNAPKAPADPSQVKGTPGSRMRSGGNEVTEHRTGEDVGEAAPLTLHEQKQPPLVSAGELFPPALPSPRRQERDDKGRALGVDLELPSRVQPWPSETALLLG